MQTCPMFILWPRGNKTSPVLYRGNNTFIDILSFLKNNSGRPLKVSKFNLDDQKKKLATVLKKIRFGSP
jgi:hypothetical protein